MEQDKILSETFRDLGRSMHYFKEAREHRPPSGPQYIDALDEMYL